MEPKRLNKYISDAGFCSRREADRLIEEGRVTVNNKIPDAGTKVGPKDKVRIDDELLAVRDEETVFLLFNKPAGIAATTDISVRNNIISALNYPAALQPIGHLERDAEGLMLLSNDTELARKMTKADTRFGKEYVVTVNKPIIGEFLTRLSEGSSPTPGQGRKKAFVAKMGANRFRIGLEPGMNHHLKRMCEALGYEVTHLQRVGLAGFTSVKLPTGHWRALTAAEIEALQKIIAQKSYQTRLPADRNADFVSMSTVPDKVHLPKRPARVNATRAGRPAAGSKRGSSAGTWGNVRNATPKGKTTPRSATPGKRTPAPGGRRGRTKDTR